MSASREKRRRQGQDGISAKQQAAMEQAQKDKKFKLTAIVITVLVLALIVFSVYTGWYLPNYAPKNEVALEVGDHDITAAEMNFYYMDYVYQFYNTNSSFLNYLLDTSKSLDEQYYDEEAGLTWADYFFQEAAKNAATAYAIYDDAVAAGQGLTEEQQAAIDEDIELMKSTLSSNAQYRNFNSYLAQSYGKGCDEETYRQYMEVQTVVDAYSQAYQDSLTYSAEDLQAAYDADPALYTSVSYRSFYISKSYCESEGYDAATATEEESAAEAAASFAAAGELANEMVAACAGDEADFAQWARDIVPEASKATYEPEDATLSIEVAYENAATGTDEGKQWLFDEARQVGDIACFAASENGYYVYYFIGTHDNDYTTANVREIYIGVTADLDENGDGTPETVSEDLWASAETQANDLMAQWQAGDQSEDSFALLATTNSADMNTAMNGGLMENVAHYELMDPLHDWVYAEDRKAGDCEIVKLDMGFEDGYYLMYYVGEGANRRDAMITEDLASADYSEWFTAYQEKYAPVTVESGLKYVSRDITFYG